jgi:ferredoxin/flavodoxin---NADP+ reductase
MRRASHETIVVTDDGSYGERGFVTTVLERMLRAGRPLHQAVAIGPAVMMKSVAAVTRPFRVPTLVSLNTLMVDGTGMCGGCRVSVGGETRFVCVDGPEFDAHQVDFDLLMRRQAMYREQEKRSHAEYEAHRCRSRERDDVEVA